MMLPKKMFFCNRCHSMCEESQCRMTSKQSQKFKCHKCNASFSKCYKKFGKWPLPDFEGQTDDEKAEFCQKAADLSKEGIAKLYDECVSKYANEETFWEAGGEFLPLEETSSSWRRFPSTGGAWGNLLQLKEVSSGWKIFELEEISCPAGGDLFKFQEVSSSWRKFPPAGNLKVHQRVPFCSSESPMGS